MTSSISSPGLLTARYSDLGKCIAFPKGALFPVKGTQFGSQLCVQMIVILIQADHEVKLYMCAGSC